MGTQEVNQKLHFAMFDQLVKMLDSASENEKNFCHDVQLEFERASWEVFRMKNELQELVERLG